MSTSFTNILFVDQNKRLLNLVWCKVVSFVGLSWSIAVQLYGHLPPIMKTIQVRWTRHAGHCWRSRDELISDVLQWTPYMTGQKQDDQHEHTFSSYVRIQDVALKTCQRRWTLGKSGKRGSGISVLAAQHDDDDSCSKDHCPYLWTFLQAAGTFSKNRPIRDKDRKHLKSVATILKYSDTQLLVEVSARMMYLLDYRQWVLWTKDSSGDKDFNKYGSPKEDWTHSTVIIINMTCLLAIIYWQGPYQLDYYKC